MFGRLSKLALLASLMAFAMGCAHARLVEVHGDGGGVVAIPDNSNSWPSRNRRQAEKLMAERCPQGYVIDHESEVVVGQITKTDVKTDQHGTPILTPLGLAPVQTDTHQATRYIDQKEWRIWFRPKDAAPSAIAPAGGPGPVVPASAAPPAPY
jgi:hypothetical protein